MYGSVALFVFFWCEVCERGVASGAVVVFFDPGECLPSEVFQGRPGAGVDEFLLVGGEEGF